MSFHFQRIQRTRLPDEDKNKAYLIYDNWDDYGFKTMFHLVIFDENSKKYEIGDVKIGFKDQEGGKTFDSLDKKFEKLEESYFSLGQDADFYKNLVHKLPESLTELILNGLNDVALNADLLMQIEEERVFTTSFLRSVHKSSIQNQFRRIIDGGVALTEFKFDFKKDESEDYSGMELSFEVDPDSKPSSNMHVLIGRNGIGKTTILNSMVESITSSDSEQVFFDKQYMFSGLIDDDYFTSLVSVSFSAFDPFIPPVEQPDKEIGTCFFYIGLKKQTEEQDTLKNHDDLCNDFTESFSFCLSLSAKRERLKNALKTLESDKNFEAMNLSGLFDISGSDDFKQIISQIFEDMSSGHGCVLLTTTRLVETVEEKTLVLIDEPESHLHPPLLSAFTRAVSDLLLNRNGVAIIATHSPVVLQEVPRNCVSVIRRNGLVSNVDRPEIETFGENVGVLTREVFGLEVSKSGFHKLLSDAVENGGSYEEIMDDFDYQIGHEGKAILRALILHRDTG